jgi:GNAT superfamily N-acetyltransferase
VSCVKASLNHGRIGLVGVAPGYQGKGVGKGLVQRALQWCVEQDFPRVEVVTQGRNLQAQRLYQSCGFQIERTELWYHKWFSRVRTPVPNARSADTSVVARGESL